MAAPGDGIVQGRQLFHAGRLHTAEQCWRECLKEAYAQGNHAATFVLSKNLGDDAYYEDQDDYGSEDGNGEEAAEPGMLCAACLDADGTILDLNELFYCQPCFDRKNQPCELPTTRTAQQRPASEAKKQGSGIAKSSSSASNGTKKFYDQTLATLASTRRQPLKKGQVYAAPIPTTSSSAPRTFASCFASRTSKTPSKENGRSRSSASSSATSTRATPKATAAPPHLSSRAAPSTPTQEESKSFTPNATSPSSPSSTPPEPLTRANRATSDATTAAGPGMACAVCLNTNATMRDWTGSFYCQPCFDRKNQIPIDFVADVVEPDELPATKPVGQLRAAAAKEKSSRPAKPSPTAKHGSKRLVDEQAASMSLRGLSIPPSSSSAPQTLTSHIAPSAPETPSEEKVLHHSEFNSRERSTTRCISSIES